MLTGKLLGQAIRQAAELKKQATGATLADMARHFHVKPPSVQDWLTKGTIDKGRLQALWLYFSDVVGPEHWGLESFPQARIKGSVFEELTAEELKLLDDFRMLTDPEQARYAEEIGERAALLRAYLGRQMTRIQSVPKNSPPPLAQNALPLSTDQQAPKPAEQYGLESLSRDADDSSAKDNGTADAKNHRGA